MRSGWQGWLERGAWLALAAIGWGVFGMRAGTPPSTEPPPVRAPASHSSTLPGGSSGVAGDSPAPVSLVSRPADTSDPRVRGGLFRPLVSSETRRGRFDSPTDTLPPVGLRRAGSELRQEREERAPDEDEDGSEAAGSGAGERSLAYVGLVSPDGDAAPYALLEDPERRLSRAVREGEVAFGFKVVEFDSDSLVLERDGERRTLVLGADKPVTKVEILNEALASRLNDPRNIALASLPREAASAVLRVLPTGGYIARVRSDRDDGQRIYRVEKRVDGLQYQAAVTAEGRLVFVQQQIKSEALPEAVILAANEAIPGFTINKDDTPSLWDRNGRRYYAVEIKKEGSREEVDLRISPEGQVVGQG
ncbi:MAG: hypothetical protein ACK47B_13975 [Armatimonadota bacterium]